MYMVETASPLQGQKTTTKQAVQLKHKIQPSGTGARPYEQAPVPCDALSPPLKGQTLTEATKQRRAEADW